MTDKGSGSNTSADAYSSTDSNQFGSPAAVGIPQPAATLVFSATKLIADLTGTSVLAARSPKLRTPPPSAAKTGKIKVRSLSMHINIKQLSHAGATSCFCWYKCSVESEASVCY